MELKDACSLEGKLWQSCAVLSHSVVPNSLQPHGLEPIRFLCPWDSPGQDAGVGCHALLQRIFPSQGLNPGLPHCRWILYQLSHKGSPRIWEWLAYPSSSRSSLPRNQTGVSRIIISRYFWGLLGGTTDCFLGFPGGTSGKEPFHGYRRLKRQGFDTWVRKIPWRRAWQPTPASLPRESHELRSLEGYSP